MKYPIEYSKHKFYRVSNKVLYEVFYKVCIGGIL